MSYTLCVIDMQNYFPASKGKRVRAACVREVRKAIKEQATILFVEYKNYGPTLPLLTNITKRVKYKKAHHVLKDSDDGSQKITAFIKARHLARLNMRVCGVNTPYCVQSTVSGLTKKWKNSTIHLVADACDSSYSKSEHTYALKHMATYPNVKVVNKLRKY